MQNELREKLAEYAHEAWSGWMKYMFEKGGAIASANNDSWTEWHMYRSHYHRWQRQMNTPYERLPESEKASDRAEADKMLAIFFGDMNAPDPVWEAIDAMTPEQLDDELRHFGHDPEEVKDNSKTIMSLTIENCFLRKRLEELADTDRPKES